jgi:hypothetical protein
VLLGVVEELQDIIADNDPALAAENFLDTHDGIKLMWWCLRSFE